MRYVLIVLILVAGLSNELRAEVIDTSFNSTGRILTSNSTVDQKAVALVGLPNGNVARVTSFPMANMVCADPVCMAVDYYSDSGVFQTGGLYNIGAPFYSVEAAAVDSAGRLVVVGSTPVVAGEGINFRVVRLNAGGGYDESFGIGGAVSIDFFGGEDYAKAVAIDNNDNIVVVGVTALSTSDYDFAIARLRSNNGSLDTTFSTDGKTTVAFDLAATSNFDAANAVAIGNDGKIMVGGVAFDQAILRYRAAFTRLTPTGSLDPTLCNGGCSYSAYPGIQNGLTTYYFGTFSSHADIVRGIAVAADGGFYIVGESYQDNGSGRRSAISRFGANGGYAGERLDAGAGGNASFKSVRLADATATRVLAVGESGSNQNTLLLQAFSYNLTPLSNYGTCLTSNSAHCITGGAGSSDSGADIASELNLDRLGRPLFSSNVVIASGGAQQVLVARYTNATGPKPDLIVRHGFQ